MKPKHGLPCGVRLIAGLGGAGGTTALALAVETVAELERRATLSIGVVLPAVCPNWAQYSTDLRARLALYS